MGIIESIATRIGYQRQQECEVCYENFDSHKHEKITLPCEGKHVFCRRCVSKILVDEEPKCPYCRADISSFKPPRSLRERMVRALLSGVVGVSIGASIGAAMGAVAASAVPAAGGICFGSAAYAVGSAFGYKVSAIDNAAIKSAVLLAGWVGIFYGAATVGASADNDAALIDKGRAVSLVSQGVVSIMALSVFVNVRKVQHDLTTYLLNKIAGAETELHRD